MVVRAGRPDKMWPGNTGPDARAEAHHIDPRRH